MISVASNLSGVDPAALVRDVMGSVFAEREALTVSQWADRHRELDSKFSDRAGRWSTMVTPYMRGPMDAYNAPETREISFVKPAQVAGTEWLINTTGYIIDMDPGNLLFVYPTEDSARETNADRLIPALRRSEAVARHFGPSPRDTKVLAINLDRMNIYFRGTNSEVQLDRVPAAIVIIDELDRCNPRINVVEALRARLTTYDTRSKFLKTGTPSDEGVGIDREYKEADDRRQWHVPCPRCGQFHERYARFGQVRWEKPDPERHFDVDPQRVRDGAWFECPDCGGRIEGHESRWQARNGVWISEGERIESSGQIARGPHGHTAGQSGEKVETPLSVLSFDALRGRGTVEERGLLARAGVSIVNARARPGRHVAFRLSGLDSTLVSNPFGFVAVQFVVNRGEPDREWVTRKLGEAWRAKGDRVAAHEMRALAKPVADGGYARKVVPDGAVLLVMTADLQRDRLVWVVRAYGAGMRDTWLVDCGETPSPEGDGLRGFDAAAMWTFPMRSGDRRMRITAMGVDSGDGMRAKEVYDWSLRMRQRGVRAYPMKGVESAQMVTEVQEVHLAGSKLVTYRAVGLTLLKVNSQQMSDEIMARARGQTLVTAETASDERAGLGAGGVFGLFADVPAEYLAQLTAVERRLIDSDPRRKGRVRRPTYQWAPRPGFEHRDHFHDAERYNFALAIFGGGRLLTRPVGLVGPDGAAPIEKAATKGPRTIGKLGGRESGGGGVGLVPRGRGER